MSRKPESPKASRPQAKEVLDTFMKEKGIVFALGRPNIQFTNTNVLLVEPPKIMIAYVDELETNKTN